MIRRDRLFHDLTLDYHQPPQPKPGKQVFVYFRCGQGDAGRITLIYDSEVASDEVEMKIHHSEDGFDYYLAKGIVPKTSGIVQYYFRIESEGETLYYDQRGAGETVPDKFKFRMIPNFYTPDWAKGAVMYQIFVDRFRNGDPDNDVLTDEYNYVGGKSIQVTNWNQYPDPNADIREFYGGDLQGVLDKLDYLKDLGIEVIYFNPLFVSPSSHKYDTQDYDHIDPHFGKIVSDKGNLLTNSYSNKDATRYIDRVTNKKNLEASDELFAKVVAEAHKRGIRVILDGVFNHCGSFNKWMDKECIYENAKGYEKGAYVSKDSPYHDYFGFSGGNWPYNNNYEGWWGYDTLPKLNYEGSKKLEDYIIEIGKKWVSAPYFADGWRLDVAADLGHSEDYNHSFWRRFRKAVKEANPDALILAEHYGSAHNWLVGGEWDSVMNYDAFMEPLTYFLTGMEKHSDGYHGEFIGNVDRFWDCMLGAAAENFSHPSLLVAMNELSNHDHSRFLTRTNHVVGRCGTRGHKAAEEGVSKAIMRQAVVVQMTWPGAPTIYYGDEAGVCGFTDPDNRRTYPWGTEDQEMIRFHKEMIHLHKTSVELKTGSLVRLDAGEGILAYGRFNRISATIVVINTKDYLTVSEISLAPLGIPEEARLVRVMESGSKGFKTDALTYSVKNGKLVRAYGADSAVVLQYSRITAVNEESFWSTNFFRM
ncbi:glycoside hydrolase family 13 protein [Butyrivibrio sp. INlla16]|uniref:glycoside hydrolase family 13 protein n=1 Tax=Butyrivibrio sp. INlla16 TaxID=1520807 RepID=UPI00088388E2|nr:glycoside hydrolase family 13 protein [Butyrivibrio sp. INlla16]SDB61594.1 alpha-glucosidase [Butyrivibrio sp. INlla16]